MKTATIIRNPSDAKQTLGTLNCEDIKFFCDTLELPDKGNQHDISCIPIGDYICKWTRSNRLSEKTGHDYFTYEVLNVPNRSGIRIHAASFFHDLKGCISIGKEGIDIDKDGEQDLQSSRDTLAEFETKMNHEDFKLSITNSIV